MSDQVYLTAEGEAKMRAELEQLKKVERPALAARLRDAIQMGDLSENADYHKAKEDQGFLEGRIQELDYLLQRAVIIDANAKRNDTVQVGSYVVIQEEDLETEKYYIVGAKEADPRNGKISNESPIGRALMGKRPGDTAEAQTPNGVLRLKIIQVE